MKYPDGNYQQRKRNRLQNYDYSQDGWYFITACVKGWREFLGGIKDNKMCLNECGKIVLNQWLWLEKQYEYVKLDEYIVMPNHIHGILIIENEASTDRSPSTDRSRPVRTDSGRPVRTNSELPVRTENIKIKSLSELIGAFKTTSSKLIHQNGLKNFAWHRSFYDHIIRNETSLSKIREYIINNPLKWSFDRYNKETL